MWSGLLIVGNDHLVVIILFQDEINVVEAVMGHGSASRPDIARFLLSQWNALPISF